MKAVDFFPKSRHDASKELLYINQKIAKKKGENKDRNLITALILHNPAIMDIRMVENVKNLNFINVMKN